MSLSLKEKKREKEAHRKGRRNQNLKNEAEAARSHCMRSFTSVFRGHMETRIHYSQPNVITTSVRGETRSPHSSH